ncbi:hypothetical protein LTR86_005800 [Recurvomyces mirabilis]|nr:hypothetical protein LTR86_005800 [Recurvomyces mirabilis]
MSIEAFTTVAPFARLCQASHLLVSRTEVTGIICSPLAPWHMRLKTFSWDVHACIEPDSLETIGGNRGIRLDLQQHALSGYKETIHDVLDLAVELEQHNSADGLQRVPVVTLFCLYSTAGTFAWYFREQERQEDLNALMEIRQVLGTVARKYGVSSKPT